MFTDHIILIDGVVFLYNKNRYFCVKMAVTQSINDTYITFQKILRKNQQGYASPTDFNKFINEAQMSYFNDLRGAKSNQYARNLPSPLKGFDRTKYLMETLTPFVILDATLTISNGAANKPELLCETLALNSADAIEGIKYVGPDRWASYKNSLIDTPSTAYPIYKESETQYVFLPATGLTTPTVSYLKYPTTAVWGFTTVDDRPVYNAGTSVDLEWDKTQVLNIIMIALSLMGISIKDQQMVNYAEQQRALGN